MKRRLGWAVVGMLMLTGCATAANTPGAQASGNVYRGEVWTWDQREGIVTLLQGTQIVRIKVTPDQLRGLRRHEIASVRGELAPPAEIPQQIVTPPPMTPVPRGTAQQTEVNGTVASVDPTGLAAIDSDRGRLVVWTVSRDSGRFAPGVPVRVRITVQPVDMVPLADPRAQAASRVPDASQPSALATGEPGDWAVITGRVLRVDPNGMVTVESPRGAVTVAVPDASRFADGTTVQVRTLVQPGS